MNTFYTYKISDMLKKYTAVLMILILPKCIQAQNLTAPVGIGTTTPRFSLHISSANTLGLGVQSSEALSLSSGAFARLYSSSIPTAVNQRLGGILIGTIPASGSALTGAQIDALSEDAWTEGTSHRTFLRFMTANSAAIGPVERMRITADGNILIPRNAQFGHALTDRFTYDNQFQPHYGLQWTMDSWSSAGSTFWASAYGGMKFFTQGVPRLTITGGGNVGIGTEDTKGYKFAVNGDAMFTKIKVKVYSSWPDYVFHPDYQLPSLHEIEKYIRANGHLSDIPSAAEVEKDGLDLGEMNRKLLQKVEELTLYLIEEHKKNQENEASIIALRQKIQQLERSLGK
jgi:hypothetical protein